MKLCNTCADLKPLDAFNRKADAKDGRQYQCRECSKKRLKAGYEPDWWRDKQYRREYGITLEDWEALFAAQAGKCAICRTSQPGGRGKRLHVDHCHETGTVRGLLCYACNTALGLFRHNPQSLEQALLYLKRNDADRSTLLCLQEELCDVSKRSSM